MVARYHIEILFKSGITETLTIHPEIRLLDLENFRIKSIDNFERVVPGDNKILKVYLENDYHCNINLSEVLMIKIHNDTANIINEPVNELFL